MKKLILFFLFFSSMSVFANSVVDKASVETSQKTIVMDFTDNSM